MNPRLTDEGSNEPACGPRYPRDRSVLVARFMLASAIASTISAVCLIAALILMGRDTDPEPCHAPPVPACAEMGTCTYNHDTCTYEYLENR